MSVPEDCTKRAHSLTDQLTNSNRTTGHCQSMEAVFTGGSPKQAPRPSRGGSAGLSVRGSACGTRVVMLQSYSCRAGMESSLEERCPGRLPRTLRHDTVTADGREAKDAGTARGRGPERT